MAACLPTRDDEPTCTFISSPPRHSELIDEIEFIQLKATEDRAELYTACPTYNAYLTTVQKDTVRPRHRHIVFEWILKIGDQSMLQLNTKSLHYAFYYFDRYLSLINVAVNQLQLVATACVWVASKVCSDQVRHSYHSDALSTHFPIYNSEKSWVDTGTGGACVSAVPARRCHRTAGAH